MEVEARGSGSHRARRFEIKMVRSSAGLVEVEFPLYRKYQIQQHKDPPSKVILLTILLLTTH